MFVVEDIRMFEELLLVQTISIFPVVRRAMLYQQGIGKIPIAQKMGTKRNIRVIPVPTGVTRIEAI